MISSDAEKTTFEEEINRSGSLVYYVVGISMLPLLHQNQDIVIIKQPEARLKKYDVALYKTSDGRYILHRVLKVRNQDYVICGDNCVSREYGITDDDIIGVMVEFLRKGRRHSVDDRGYRIYCHFIGDLYYIKAPCLWVKFKIKRILNKIKRRLNKKDD